MSDTGPVTLYSDPVLYQPPDTSNGYSEPGLRYPGLYDRPGYIPDISQVDYDQPLQIVESAHAQPGVTSTSEAVIMEQSRPVRNSQNDCQWDVPVLTLRWATEACGGITRGTGSPCCLGVPSSANMSFFSFPYLF